MRFLEEPEGQARIVLKFVLKPFSLDAMKQLRRYLLLQHDVTLPLPKQAKGSRGGATVEWVMAVDDTDFFEKIVGAEWPQSSRVTRGTGRMFSWDSFTGWIPPLSFIVRTTDPTRDWHPKLLMHNLHGERADHGARIQLLSQAVERGGNSSAALHFPSRFQDSAKPCRRECA